MDSNSALWSASRDLGRSLANARRDVLVLSILIAAVFLLIWNGSEFFQRLTNAEKGIGPGLKIALIALTLNVALILFGWRRYVDLLHESEPIASETLVREVCPKAGLNCLALDLPREPRMFIGSGRMTSRVWTPW